MKTLKKLDKWSGDDLLKELNVLEAECLKKSKDENIRI